MAASDRPLHPTPAPHSLHLGRRAFLGLSAVSAAALFLGKSRVPSFNFAPGAASANGFTIYTVTDGYPTVHPAAYRLTIGGMVAHPLTLSLADILQLPAVREERFYQCVTGWTVPHATWTGIRLADLLHRVAPQGGAGAVKFSSFDGEYTESLTLAQATKPDVLLAYKLMDKPLSTAQGAPLRLVVPGMYGYKFAKWIDRVELIPHPIDGYWERNGYDRDAYIGASNAQFGPGGET
jgi:DMSO/TMAO reductase YedYZ molybdopterin-dependent catalytic subunit